MKTRAPAILESALVRWLLVGLLAGGFCFSARVATAESAVRINEWMANNAGFLKDEDGDFGDWIELFNSGNVFVDLSGWYLTDDLANSTKWAFPAGVILSPGAFVFVWADGKNRSNHTSFSLNGGGEAIGLATPNGVFCDVVQFGQQSANVSEGRFPDGAASIGSMATPTPGGPNLSKFPITAVARIALSPAGAIWRYFDKGEDLGTSWRQPFYNDSAWASGRAQLGFGDNDEVTVIDGGPAGQRYITTYFRRAFTVTNAANLTNLTLRLMRDDGAAVYLNGVEIHRDNLPAGTLSYSTLALQAVAGADETNFFSSSVGPVQLTNSLNVLAVEVHQSAITSSDLSFDLELLGGGGSLPGVVSQPGAIVVPPGSCVDLQAPAMPGVSSYQWLRNDRILEGATNQTLQLCGLSVADGGAYGLLATGTHGRTIVLNATLVSVSAPMVPAGADAFSGSMTIVGTNGAVLGSNTNATREGAEPFHGGVAGGRSMWFTWNAPASGIATLDTQGSTFDTLLGVYTGFALTNLTDVASDDERGGFATSRVQFNAVANTAYRVAVDGFEGASGYFNLRWSLEVTPAILPTITSAPESQTVPAGGAAFFSVKVAQQDATFQWLFDGQPISNAVSSSLFIPSVTASTLGAYSVRVRNSWGRVADSLVARLMQGDCGQFYDRPYEFLRPCPGAFGQSGFAAAALVGSTNPPSAGVPGSIGFGPTESGVTRYARTDGYFICDGRRLYSPQYFDVQVQDDGYLTLDTCGSEFPVLLGLYHKASRLALEPANRIGCDLRSADFSHPASVSGQVTGGVYTVVVGNVASGATSDMNTLRLNLRLNPSCFLRSSGAAPVTLRVNTNRVEWEATPFTDFLWYRDGNFLERTMGPALVVGALPAGLQPGHIGTYSLRMFNSVRSDRRIVADLILTNAPAPHFYRLRAESSVVDGVRRQVLQARSSRPVWFESTAEVMATPVPWTALGNRTTNYVIDFLECDEPFRTQRFFRQRTLAP